MIPAALIVSMFGYPQQDLQITGGNVGLQNRTPSVLLVGSAPSQHGRLQLGMSLGNVTQPSHVIKVAGSPNPIKALPGFRLLSAAKTAPFIDTEGYWVGIDGKAPPIALDAAAITNATILTARDQGDGDSSVSCYTVAAGQVAAGDVLRLTGGLESSEFRITVRGAQGFDLIVKDDATNTTLYTFVAGFIGSASFRKNGTSYEMI